MRLLLCALLLGCSSKVADPDPVDAAADTAVSVDASCSPSAGPICCAPGEPPSEPFCTGPMAWQCPIGMIPKNRAEGCGGCSSSATSEACVTCCRQPDAPNYGGFELYASDVCAKCPECMGLSPCGTNVTPAAGQACVACLQGALTMSPPTMCLENSKCKQFAACLSACPLK